MSGSIESFVEKLQTEGVQTGRKKAKSILKKARAEADKIVADARAEAAKIVAKAKSEAERDNARNKVELELAVRDTIAQLRSRLTAIVEAVLAAGVREHLSDSDFLAKLLYEVFAEYNRHQIVRKATLQINVAKSQREKLTKWALGVLQEERTKEGNVHFDLTGSLNATGFEFKIAGATVEVTQESVVGVLSDLVAPELRALVQNAQRDVGQGKQTPS